MADIKTNQSKLYKALQGVGFTDLGSEAEFSERLKDAGNRQKLYNAMQRQGFTDLGDYASFERRIYEAPKEVAPTQSVEPASAEVPVENKEKVIEKPKQVEKKGSGISAEDLSRYGSIISGARQTAGDVGRSVRKVGYQSRNAGLDIPSSVNLGENRKVKETGTRFDVETGKVEKTYTDSEGNEYNQRGMADFVENVRDQAERYQQDPVGSSLKDAEAERLRLNNEMQALAERTKDKTWVDRDGTVHYGDLSSDEEMKTLLAAYRKNEEYIRTLTYERDDAGFWQHLGGELGDLSSWNPFNAVSDTNALLRAKQKLDSGQELSPGDNLLLANTLLSLGAHSQYDKNRSALFRAGGIAAESIRLLPDFAMGMGPMKAVASPIMKGTGKVVSKAIGKKAAETIAGKILTKVTGIGLGTLAGGAVMTNTIQSPRLAAKTVENMTGNLTLDDNGNYQFEDGDNFLTAALHAEQELIPEAASEALGEFLPGVGTVLSKVGLKRIAGGLEKIQGTKWYQGYSRALEQVGFHGAPGEMFEEYAGDVYSAVLGDLSGIMGNEEGKGGWGDLDKHIDIALGTVTLGAMLHAPSLLYTGKHGAQYYYYRHNVNKADKAARSVMDVERWNEIKSQIDNSTNETISDVVSGILKDGSLSEEARGAIFKYGYSLQRQRGHLLALTAYNKEEKDEQGRAADVLSNSYASGYETTDAEGKDAIRNNATLAEETLDGFGKEFASWVKDGKEPEMAKLGYMMSHRDVYSDAQIAAVSNYYQTRFALDGLTQGEADREELEGKKVRKVSHTALRRSDDGFEVMSFDKDGNLVDSQTFKTEDEAEEHRAGVRMQIRHDALVDNYTAAGELIGRDVSISVFENEQGWMPGTVERLVNGDPMKMTDEELEMVSLANDYLSGFAHPLTVVNEEAGRQSGIDAAEDSDIDTDMPNEEVISSVVEPYFAAKENLASLFDANEELAGQVQALEQMGRSPQEIIGLLDSFSKDEVQAVTDYYNTKARFDSFMTRSREKIDERVQLERGRRTFKGTINGNQDQENLIEVTDGENTYTLLGGNITTDEQGRVVSSDSGAIIVLDADGEIEVLGDRSGLTVLPSETTLDMWENSYRSILDEHLSEIESRDEEPAVPPQDANEGNDGSTEQALIPNSSEWHLAEQPAAVPDLLPTQETNASSAGKGTNNSDTNQGINVKTDKYGVKLYEEGVPVDDAIRDIQNDGLDVQEFADLAISEAQTELSKIKEPKTRADLMKNTARRKELQNTIDYYTRMKERLAEMEKEEDNPTEKPQDTEDAVEPTEEPQGATEETTLIDGAPEWRYDNPADARGRGFKIVEGQRIDRQDEKPMPQGMEVEVQYSTKDKVKGRMTVSELGEVQGSHLTNGQRNEKHFIPEAQPKSEFGADRQAAAQTNASEANFRPELMLTFNGTQSAYSGSTTQTNRRGEVIQGNGRRNLAEYIYAPGNEAVARRYKDFLKAHAAELGTTADAIEQMEKPFAHIVLDVTDAEAIRLGQFTAQDLETGGRKIPDVTSTATKLGEKFSTFANIVLRHDDPDASLSERIDANADEAVKWLNRGYINDTEAKTLLEDKAAARQFIKGLLTDTLFSGASPDLRTMFYELPKNIQSAIVSVVGREVTMDANSSILKDIQESIQAYHELITSSSQFAGVKGKNYEERKRAATAAVNDWLRQINIDNSSNQGKYSNFALELAKLYRSLSDQKTLAGRLREYYDLVSGSTRQLGMFDEPGASGRMTSEEAIKQVFGVDYGRQRTVPVAGDVQAGQGGQQGSPDGHQGGERGEGEGRSSESGRRNPGDAEEVVTGGSAQSRDEYLASHPLTEAQIMADTEATEDEKLNAIDFLNGEDNSAISRFYYDGIFERAQKQAVDKINEIANKKPKQKSEEHHPQWQYNLHYDKKTKHVRIDRDDVSGPIPIGDGRWHLEANSLEEMRSILENPANNLGDVYKEVEASLHNQEIGEKLRSEENPTAAIETAAQSFREEQKSKDRKDIDDALKEFNDFLDSAKGSNVLDAFMRKGLEGNDKAQANLLDAFTLTNDAQRMFLKDLLRLASKVGYAYIKSGVHDAQAWSKKMSETIGAKLKDVLGWNDNIISEFTDEVWNQKYTVDGQRMRLSEHAERLKNGIKNTEEHPYTSFREFVNDSGINVTDDVVKGKLQKYAEVKRAKFGFEKSESPSGYTAETTNIDLSLYPGEEALLKQWRNGTATWVDEENQCVYSITYNAAQYIGRKDNLIIKKEYLTKEKPNNAKGADTTVNDNKQEDNVTENVVSSQQEASEKPKTKDGWLRKMNEVFKELCKKYGVPEEPIIFTSNGQRYGFDYRITKGYQLDQFEPYYEAYKKKLDEDVEPATEKQLAFIQKLAESDEKKVLEGVKLNKISASYVISILKSEESAQTAQEFEEAMNELKKVAELAGKKFDEELQGDSAEFAERQQKVEKLSGKIHDLLDNLVSWNDAAKPMSAYKKVAKELGLDDLSDTDLQELIETEIVNLAREYSHNNKWTDEQKFKHIVSLYQKQPSLTARDNDRINLQQYSTPAPMAFVMGKFLKEGKEVKSGLEPSAGNGILTIGLPKERMHVNDIDEMRLSNLAKQGFGEVTSQDGTQPFGEKKYDVVVTNPPFGNVTPKTYDGLYEISGLEHQMAINALESMKDDGRAAIIIGGNTEYNQNGTIKGKDRAFFNYLYAHYNVVDVINMDGKTLYSRQGTGFPVRMILINGRKEFNPRSFAPTIQKARAERVNSYEELYKRVNDDILSDNNESAGVHDTSSGESNGKHDNGNAGVTTETGVRNVQPGGSSKQRQLLDTSGQPVSGGVGNTSKGADTGTDTSVGERGDVVHGAGSTAMQSSGSATSPAEQGGNVPNRRDNPERPDGRVDVPVGGRSRPSVEVRRLGTEKVPYRQQSKNPYSLQSQMPAEQAEVVKKALEELGDVDEFLVKELGYSSVEDLHHGSQSPEKHGGLAAEQIDSVAMAIHQMNQGNAFIIGDQTGIGKGRQAAALIRYGVKKGGCPVFITVKKGLFSDMYRDLCDIGSPGLRPFIWSADDEEHSADVTDKNGNVVYKRPSDKEQKRVVDYINKYGKLPPEYDYIVTTYDSFKGGTMVYEEGQKKARNFGKKSPTTGAYNSQAKRDALERLAENSYVIMDESHNAGGETSAVSGYLQYITTRAKGVTFLSATFAKRPGNMPIYSLKTAIAKAGVKVGELIDAVKQGGATFQEIMSKALTEAGQMIRRERDMTGVTIDWRGIDDEAVIEKQRQQYDTIIGLFNDIIDFQRRYVDPIVNKKNDEAADEQGEVDHTPGTRDMGINNTPFASRTYNMVQQVLLSLKAEETAKRAIEHLKAGRKPVIALANTNEGAADEVAGMGEDMEMPDLSVNLKKGLQGTLRITKKDAFGNTVNEMIPFDELSEEGRARYQEIMDAIENASSGLSLSPIDVIKNELKKAGYKVGELTGRKQEFVYNEDGTVKRVKRQDSDKKRTAADFNNGKLDVLILNKSAGTGISLHASSKFEDQRQRVMIVAQAQGDVNDEVQIRGRIDRTGQVLRGMYEYVVSQIPSEQRLLMMLKAKLRSLDANTTSSQKSKFNEMQVQDIINKYGDDIVIQYLAEHPDLAAKMVDPLKWGEGFETTPAETLIANASKEGEAGKTASKVLGRMALLKVAEQEKMLAEIGDLYQAEIDRLNEMGENDLEITEMPLRAKTLKKDVWEEGVEPGGKNPFADNSYVEEVEMDVLRKPMKAEEVKKSQARLLGEGSDGRPNSWEDYKRETMAKVDQWVEEKKSETRKVIEERAKKKATAEKEKYAKAAKKAQEKNGMTDEEIEKNAQYQYNHFYDEEMKKVDAAVDAIESQRETFADFFDLYTTDGVYAIPSDIYDLDQLTFEPSFGKLIDVKISDNFSTSTSTITFATLDGRRKITVPISGRVKQQNGERRNLFGRITSLTAQARDGFFGSNVANTFKVLSQSVDNWDRLTSTATRKKGYIITGNLLKALTSLRSQRKGGKLISYTTDTGEIRQGILMSDNFDPGVLTSKNPISSAKEDLDDWGKGRKITSADGEVTIKNAGYDFRDRADKYGLIVPKSKKRGEKYFNDEALLSLMDGQFEGSTSLRAEFKGSNLDAVLKRLDELGVTVESTKEDLQGKPASTDTGRRYDEDIDEGEPQKNGDSERINNRERKAHSSVLSAHQQRIAAHVEQLVDKLGTKSKTTVYHSLDEVPADVRRHIEERHRQGKKVRGWYENGRVFLFLPDIGSVYEAERTIWHETVAHHGLRELVGAENYNKLLTQLWLTHRDGDMGKWVTERMQKNGWDLAEAIDEYLAREAEKNPFAQPGLWQRLRWMVAELLHKMGFASDPTISDIQYLFWVSRNRLMEGDAMSAINQSAFLHRLEQAAVRAGKPLAADYVNMNAERVEDIYNPDAEGAYDDGKRYSEETDEEVIERLEKEPKVKVYRAMQLIDGKLYPPMNAKVNGQWQDAMPLGRWSRADEHPELVDKNGKYTLDKGNGKKVSGVVYAPYMHGSTTMLNDQFKEAQDRPELVVVEAEMPESELTSGYQAEKSPRKTGMLDWKAGTIQGQLTGTRRVMLSRWVKPVRIVPASEVAANIKKMIDGQVEVMPTNVVTPEVREELEKLGVKFVKTNNQEIVQEGEHKGEQYSEAYGKKSKNTGRRYDEDIDEPLEDSVKRVYEETLNTKSYVVTEAFQDAMLALKVFYNSALKKGEKLADSMNAYMAENLMHGKSKNEMDLFNAEHRKGLEDIVNRILNTMGWTMRDFNIYLITKSGLERNREFFVRDWLNSERKRTVRKLEDLNTAELDIYEKKAMSIAERFEDGEITEEEMNKALSLAIQESHQEYLDEVEERWQNVKERGFTKLRGGVVTFAEYLEDTDTFIRDVIDSSYKAEEHDYSGLTAIYGDESGKYKEEDILDQLMNAEGGVNGTDGGVVQELWDRIQAANRYGLERYREAGMRTDEEIDRIERMFHWYVPMRGFDMTTGEDVYQYFTSKTKINDYVGGLIKHARGRRSLANSPMATMFAMAYKAISDSNENLMRQHFYRFCQAHPTDLVVMSESWYRLNEMTGEWEESWPDIPEGATDDEIREAVKQFDAENRKLAIEGKAKKVHDVPHFEYKPIDKKKQDEHVVSVMVNGQKKLMTVIGNPRLAQALNGHTKWENGKNILSKMNARIKGAMSAAFTSYSPTFALRNMLRDWTHFAMMLNVREGKGYTKAALKYYKETLPRPYHGKGKIGMVALFKKYRAGTLDMNNEVERDFKDFMDNGGVTGYVHMQKLDKLDRELRKTVGDHSTSSRVGDAILDGLRLNKIADFNSKLWDLLLGYIESYNEAVENNARFATFRASRHYAGRTKARSAYDAKEITVNFNRKGSGHKVYDFKTQDRGVQLAAQTAGVTSQVVGEGRVFFNATIQAICTTFKNFKNPDGSLNKPYIARWASRYALPPFAFGLLLPYINQVLASMFGSGDDDEPYANLPEWVRRKNLCFYVGDNNFITIPVGQELAAFLALGDIAAANLYSPELKPVNKDWMDEVNGILTTFSPIDLDQQVTKGGLFSKDAPAEIVGKTFSVVTPLISVSSNRSWTGRPIYRADVYPSDEYTPEYKMVYNGTNPLLVAASKKLHELGGGDDVDRGKELTEVNPGIVQYLWEQYTGGPGKVLSNTISIANDVKKLVKDGEADFNIRKVEGVKAFIQQGDDRTAYYRSNAKFQKYKEDADKIQHSISGYKEDAAENPVHFMKLQELYKGAEYTRMAIIKEYNKNMRDLTKLINSTEGRERKELIQQRNMFTKYVVDMLDEIEQIDQIEDDDVKRQAKWLKYKAESEAVKTERGILKDIAGGDEKAPDIQALDKSERGQRSAIVENAVKLDKKLDRSIKKTDDREKIDRLQERKRKNLEDAVEKLDKI